ncbi:MAG TPA: lysoplasmalogenase [Chitinophagales bacterium]|nr:lysoplasmalogenase [Chitinophagales bacterium]HNL84682.1 lysoplasmalogenase [Chitinophagales bacterium]
MLALLLYLLDGVIHLISEYLHFPIVKYGSKILLMPLLALFLVSKVKSNNKLILSALFFSWLGDIFLMFPRNEYSEQMQKLLFIFGLASFLIAHVFYIFTFLNEINSVKKVSLIVENPYLVLPFLVFLFFLLYFLFPYLKDMKLPVVVYGSIINLMALMALNRKNLVIASSFYLVFIGALLFMISDTTIAVNVFYKAQPWHRIFIMSTYILAQALIVYGWVQNQVLSNKSLKI